MLVAAAARRLIGPGPVGPGCPKRAFIIYHPYPCLSLNTYHIDGRFAVKPKKGGGMNVCATAIVPLDRGNFLETISLP